MTTSTDRAARRTHRSTEAFTTAVAKGRRKARQLLRVAELLADDMREIHGRDFRVVVDHNTRFILIHVA